MLTLRRPDDWHLHLRDRARLAGVATASADFGRVLVMPNLVPPVTTAAAARAYRDRVRQALPAGVEPLMTAYLTDHTDAEDLVEGFAAGQLVAAKLYPAGATTHSDAGVTDIVGLTPVLERMAEAGIVLCVHGEVTRSEVDVFDREAVFLDTVLGPLVERVPGLRLVLEHVTTADGVAFVHAHDRVAASITPHHLWWDRNALFDGGLRPHAYCLPVLKRRRHTEALRAAAVSGHPRFFAGTDSAPHPVERKECDHGCAGVFCAPTALPTYAEVFDQADALGRLEAFVSLHGAAFYGLPPSPEHITLERRPWTPPLTWPADEPIAVFRGGETLSWRVRADA